MFSRHLTYTERVLIRRKRAKIFLISIIVLAGISLIHSFFLASYTVNHDARSIGFEKAERILATPLPFGPETLFGKLPAFRKPKLGEAVVVSAGPSPFSRSSERLWLHMVRFFSLQVLGEPEIISIGIVQALPGQEITLQNGSYTLGQDEILLRFAANKDGNLSTGTAIVRLSKIRASVFLVYWPLKHIRVP